MAKESGVKLNGSAKLIGFVVLIAGSTISVVSSIEGMRSDMRVTAEVHNEKIERLREDVKSVGVQIDRVEDDLHEHIEEHK